MLLSLFLLIYESNKANDLKSDTNISLMLEYTYIISTLYQEN